MDSTENGRSDRRSEGPRPEGDNPIQRFAATLAHELRGPLAPIGNGLRIVKLLSQDQSQIQGTLGMMERQFGQLVGLIDGLLDLGRLGSSNVRLEMNRIDLHNVISDSIEACAAAIDARQHDVAIESSGAGLVVRGDLRRLTQVFTNLLANSIKYTSPGGHIRIALGAADGMAVVTVRDDGVGICAEELPHVFDLYSQSPAHRDRSEGGLGIGLAIVRSIVSLHGGSVSAQSEGPDRGSTFTVRLPLDLG